MSIKRAALCLPVVAGLILTASAVARIAPAESQDAAPACTKNGVRANKPGHPTCGLHAGWWEDDAVQDEPVTEPAPEEGATPAGEEGGEEADENTAQDEEPAAEPAAAKECKKHPVHPNKNGHPTCGLHKGWAEHDAAPEGRAGDVTKPGKDHHTGKHGAGHGAQKGTSHGTKHGGKRDKHSH